MSAGGEGFRRSATAAWGRVDQARLACRREQVGMLTKTITGALDVDDDGVVQQTVEQRCCNDSIPEC